MEGEDKNTQMKSGEPEFVLQWGKRLRCVRVKNPNFSSKSGGGIRRKITSRIVTDANDPSFSPLKKSRSSEGFGNGKSPEKEERYYTTRGSSMGEEKENGKINNNHHNNSNNHNHNNNVVEGNGYGVSVQEKGNIVWPKLFISLSSKEKEEDFLAMKGCKLPQRPKKRAKLIQRSLLLVSPGAWLPDMCQERYEVREKKTPKKRPRGLKAMGAVIDNSDSE